MADRRPSVAPSHRAPARTPAPRCARCQHFMDDRETVERELPGLLVLSSAFGDSWGDAGLCRRHDLMLLPDDACDDFAPKPLPQERP